MKNIIYVKVKQISAIIFSILLIFSFASFNVSAEPENDEETAKTELNTEKNDISESEIQNKQGNTTIETKKDQPKESKIIKKSPLRAPAPGAIAINAFDDLKPYLYKGEYHYLGITYPALLLKSGSYVFKKDIQINLNDPYFDDKRAEIENGIISHDDETKKISVDGGNHKITFKDNKAIPLFAGIRASNASILNMDIEYPSDIKGYGLIGELVSYSNPVDGDGFDINSSIIKNVKVKVNGNIESKEAWGHVKSSNYFTNQFRKGMIASGLAGFLSKTSIEDVDLEITGNIGSDKVPDNKEFRVASAGLAFHFSKNMPNPNTPSGNEIYMKHNPEVLKKSGQIANVNINIGGNIQAYAYSEGYSAGLSNDLGDAWVEDLHLNIKGDILTKLHKGGMTPLDGEATYAHGISDEIATFINSSLDVNNIIIDAEEGMEKSNEYTQMYLVGAINSKGWSENLSNCKFTVRGKMSNNAPFKNTVGFGFGNGWNSSGKYGVDFLQKFENNQMHVGSVEIKNDKSTQTALVGLSQKVYAGKQSYQGRPEFPEASLKNNKLTVGKMDIDTPNAHALIWPFMKEATNSKDNTIKYDDINVKAKKLQFRGMGAVTATAPENTPHPCLTKGNNLEFGNINLEAGQADEISLMASFQGKDQPIEDCVVKAKELKVKLTDQNANKGSTSIAGLATYQQSPIKSCRAYIGDVDIQNLTQKPLYLGMGTAFSKNSTIENSAVFIDKDFKLDTAGTKYAGGFAGYTNNMKIDNCDYQINGKNEVIQTDKGIFAGFAGWIKDTTISNSRSLILNDWAAFTGFANGGVIDGVAHYVNKPNPMHWSALLGADIQNNKPTIKNSTLLVDKENEDTWLYRTNNVSGDSKGNYVTVVGKMDDNINREIFETGEDEITEEGKTSKVILKKGNSIGNGFIAKRSFQDKYWNNQIGRYITADEESDFIYLNETSFENVEKIGTDSSILSDDAKKGALANYINRHAGVRANNGAVIDLLGIKGDTIKQTPSEPENPSKPENPKDPKNPNMKKPGDKNNIVKTGDNGPYNMILFSMLMGVAAVAGISRKIYQDR